MAYQKKFHDDDFVLMPSAKFRAAMSNQDMPSGPLYTSGDALCDFQTRIQTSSSPRNQLYMIMYSNKLSL